MALADDTAGARWALASKDPAVIDADSFEYTVSIKQAMIVDADFGVGFIDKLSINPDFQ